MSMEIKFTIDSVVDAQRGEVVMAAVVDAMRAPEPEPNRKAKQLSPGATVYDEIWATLAEQTDGKFAPPGPDETDQQFFRRLASGIGDYPSARMSEAADAWYNEVIDAPDDQDIPEPPGFFGDEPATDEPAPPPGPRDKLKAYQDARAARQHDAVADEATEQPAPAKAKETRGKKSKAKVKAKKAAPTNGTAEPAPTDELIGVAEVTMHEPGNGEDIETARTRLREIASEKGVEWLRVMLAQHGARKVSDLDDKTVFLVLDNLDGFGTAAE